jgi:hypothetical protein
MRTLKYTEFIQNGSADDITEYHLCILVLIIIFGLLVASVHRT